MSLAIGINFLKCDFNLHLLLITLQFSVKINFYLHINDTRFHDLHVCRYFSYAMCTVKRHMYNCSSLDLENVLPFSRVCHSLLINNRLNLQLITTIYRPKGKCSSWYKFLISIYVFSDMFHTSLYSCRVRVQTCESLGVPASLGWCSRARPSLASSREMLWGAWAPCCWTAAWLSGRRPQEHSGESVVKEVVVQIRSGPWLSTAKIC